MKSIQRYRAMASICRQRAVFDPQHSWKHLGDAERWEHMAHAAIADRFGECNAALGVQAGAGLSSDSRIRTGRRTRQRKVNKRFVTSAALLP